MENLGPEAASKILIVEDCASNMMLFCDLLEREGYTTVCAETGLRAIRLARAHHPDLILLDIKLPDIDGTKVVRWIREDENLRAVPVVAVTAFAMQGDREKILNAGVDAYVSKPISILKFLEVVERFVSTKSLVLDATATQMDADARY